jgi:hypothetical protein
MPRTDPIQYSELNSQLIEQFPELFGGYAELRAMWDGDEPGPHVIYEDLLVPYVVNLVGGKESEVAIVRAVSFLERLASSSDQRVRDVLGASVLEGLFQQPTVRRTVREYMGPNTKVLADKIAGVSGW